MKVAQHHQERKASQQSTVLICGNPFCSSIFVQTNLSKRTHQYPHDFIKQLSNQNISFLFNKNKGGLMQVLIKLQQFTCYVSTRSFPSLTIKLRTTRLKTEGLTSAGTSRCVFPAILLQKGLTCRIFSANIRIFSFFSHVWVRYGEVNE